MRMQVILDFFFARPGSAPVGGGKKGEFKDWTIGVLAMDSQSLDDRIQFFSTIAIVSLDIQLFF